MLSVSKQHGEKHEKKLGFVLPCLALSLLLAACPPTTDSQADPEKLKIAILAPLSGPVPSFGLWTKEGALLAIQEWNAKGGVLGLEVVPIVEDSQCSAGPAVTAAHKVIDQDGVHYIIGEVCSGASIPVSEIANPAKVIEISPTSTNPRVTIDAGGATKEYIFRACYIDPFQGGILASFSWNRLGANTAFIMYDQSNDYAVGIADAFKAEFEALGGTIVGEETYARTDSDFSAILDKIEICDPGVVLLPDYYDIVNLVTGQAKASGITVPFVGGDGWDSADLDMTAAAGGYYTNHFSPGNPSVDVQAFIAAYAAAYKDDAGRGKVPDALAALAYDATNLLISAIEIAGKDDTASVRAAIESIDFSGISGTIAMDATHNPVKSVTILSVTPLAIVFDSVVQP
jgi:branched-chain amino acid transport system substrate-binding protein